MGKIEIKDIQELGSEVSEDAYALVAGGCGPMSCTQYTCHTCHTILNQEYCGYIKDPDED